MTGLKGPGYKWKFAAIVLVLLVVASSASATGKVYTNKDLQRYEPRPANPTVNIESSRISVDFIDAEVYQVLRMIAEEAKKKDGVEIFVSPEMSGRITVKMMNVPWTEVLKEIERRHNLAETLLGKRTMLIYQKK
jgi:type II secretory pathway component HofQ